MCVMCVLDGVAPSGCSIGCKRSSMEGATTIDIDFSLLQSNQLQPFMVHKRARTLSLSVVPPPTAHHHFSCKTSAWQDDDFPLHLPDVPSFIPVSTQSSWREAASVVTPVAVSRAQWVHQRLVKDPRATKSLQSWMFAIDLSAACVHVDSGHFLVSFDEQDEEDGGEGEVDDEIQTLVVPCRLVDSYARLAQLEHGIDREMAMLLSAQHRLKEKQRKLIFRDYFGLQLHTSFTRVERAKLIDSMVCLSQ
jgi:hypothetical protein